MANFCTETRFYSIKKSLFFFPGVTIEIFFLAASGKFNFCQAFRGSDIAEFSTNNPSRYNKVFAQIVLTVTLRP